MTLYIVVSTTDGIEAVPYPTLKEAVAAWLENLNPCDAQRDLQRAYDEDGPEAVLEMVKEMDYEQTEYLWNDGEERVEVVDIEWAVSKNEHDRKVERLEDRIYDLERDEETYGPILKVLKDNRCSFATCLNAAAEYAAETYGYASDEYWTMTSLSPLHP